jgi:hypothetical protein
MSLKYDSNILTWTGFPEVLSTDLAGQDQQPSFDDEDFDHDPATDEYLLLAWASLYGNWPGTLPAELFTADFDVSTGFSVGAKTQIRFSAQSTPNGYGFQSIPITIISGLNLDVDGNGEIGPLSDGLLVLRYLFGFSGDSLIAGVVEDDCSRCTAAEIEAYMLTLLPQLDIDGDGNNGPLTDGLLILRYYFGFRGESLIKDVVESGCALCTAPGLEEYLESLRP